MPYKRDPEFPTHLAKALKGKKQFFAIVAKGNRVEVLLGKKKIKAPDYHEAKQSLGGGSVYEGICTGKGIDISFFSVEEMPGSLTGAVKKYISEHAGKSVKPVFTRVESLGDLPEEGDEDDDSETDRKLTKAMVAALKAQADAHKSLTRELKAYLDLAPRAKAVAKEAEAAAREGDRSALEQIRAIKAYLDTLKAARADYEKGARDVSAAQSELKEAAAPTSRTDARTANNLIAALEKAAKEQTDPVKRSMATLKRLQAAAGL